MDSHDLCPAPSSSNWAPSNGPSSTSTQPLSIADMVAAAASEVVESRRSALFSSFVYVAEHQQWWSAQQRLYYNPATNLFCNVDTKQYFYYDEARNGYQPYTMPSQVAQWTRPQFRKRTLKLLGGGDAEEQLSAMSQLEVDVTEVVLDLVERCSFLADRQRRGPKRRKTAEIRHQPNHLERHYVDLDEPGIGEIYYEQRPARQQIGGNLVGDGQSTSDEEEEMDEDYYAQLEMERRRAEEEAAQHAPCIRLIDISDPRRPQLHIVTIMGAKIGYGKGMDIQLEKGEEEPQPAAQLLSIAYDSEKEGSVGEYRLGEITGDVRIGDEPAHPHQAIQHGDALFIAPSHRFSVHIHVGLNTCPGCELGLLTLPSTPNTESGPKRPGLSKNAERLRNLRHMKAEYGLLEKDDESDTTSLKYKDRARERRRHVDSEANKANAAGGIYAKCRAAPRPGCSTETVELKLAAPRAKPETTPIESGNKGFQLLKGMGWKEGEGLGKDRQGIQAPITSALKTDRSGLGSSRQLAGTIRIQLRTSTTTSRMSQSDKEKEEILAKTRERYEAADKT